MPTTLRSVNVNAKLPIEREQKGAGTLFAIACLAALLLAALAIFTMPLTMNMEVGDATWLIGP
jgi:hypothetical protein